MEDAEIIETKWNRSQQTLSITYRGEFGSQDQTVILSTKDILSMYVVLQSGNGWKTWSESGGGWRDAFMGWLKDANSIFAPNNHAPQP